MMLKECLLSHLQCLRNYDDNATLIVVEEKEKDGNCKIEIRVHSGSNYLEIDRNTLNKVKELFKHKIFHGICDGILIDLENKIIILIELKANLKFDKFKKALQQLMSSYLKTMAILNLIENFIDFKALLLIASRETQFDSFSNENDIRLVNKKQDTLFSPVNPELFGYFATLCKEAELRLKKFPFHASGLGRKFIINENLIKENVPLLFFRCEEIIDISHLIARTTNG